MKQKRSFDSEVFLKLLTPKYVLIYLHNRACFSKPFAVKLLTSLKNSWNLQKSTFIQLFHPSWAKLSEKMLFFIISETLGLLDKKLTPNYEYSYSNRENVQLPVQNELFIKPWTFYSIFLLFLESTLNLQYSEKRKKTAI